MNFAAFAKAVAIRIAQLSAHGVLYIVNTNKQEMWDTYLNSFTNDPIFKVNRHHDCSCCRHFIYQMGNVVAIKDDLSISTIWDITIENEQYQRTANAMRELILSRPIYSVFSAQQCKMGTKVNYGVVDGHTTSFNHFYGEVAKHHVRSAPNVGQLNENQSMALRALTELSVEAVSDVKELISTNNLYRGEEHLPAITAFSSFQQTASNIRSDLMQRFTWKNVHNMAACRFRNSVIGTLVTDLSDGVPLEQAVASFEAKVAPANYKRPKALVTPKMVEDAKTKVKELGLLSALPRRFANLTDVSVNNMLFADRNAKKSMQDVEDPFAGVATRSRSKKNFERLRSMPLDMFEREILPSASQVELFFEGSHRNRMVSLITAQDSLAPRLFRWPNQFSWSYTGDVTDALKDRVRKKGGNVTGEVCCRLAWNNYDDLDLHMQTANGIHICYENEHPFNSSGQLDIDMNAGGNRSREPVENIFFPTIESMPDGEYLLYVNQFSQREMKDNTFTVCIDIKGEQHYFTDTNPNPGKNAQIANIVVAKGEATVVPIMPLSYGSDQEVWGLETGKFHRVSAIMRSPNHWENPVGHEHLFFMLANCVNDSDARGFYNEFLRPELEPHRKVLELLGSKQRTAETIDQLSGVGFSRTAPAELIVRVTTNEVAQTFKLTI